MTTINQLVDRASLTAGVCIVGAGAAGLMIAREFRESGTQLVVLESGGWAARGDAQTLYGGELVRWFHGLQAGRIRVFGGTTTPWGGQCIPLDRIEFEARPRVAFSNWPIT